MVQEGRDKTQTPSRQGGSTGTQRFEPRACQTMQIESTQDAPGSQSAHTQMDSHIVPADVLNTSWDQN